MKARRLTAVLCTIITIALAASCTNSEKQNEKAKYIFLFIGDGMGNSHVAATESYLSYKAGKLGGEELLFTGFPYLGLCTTYSANANVTCSSAAGTAIACGEKTNNSMLGMAPDSSRLKSVAYDLKEDGYRIGIMSSVTINHATPASFYASTPNRDNYYEISQQIPASGFEYFAGAGFVQYNGKDGQQEATDTFLEKNGYKVCYGVKEFKENADKCDKIVFCQESNRKTSAGNYVSSDSEMDNASLATMVQQAIDFLGTEKPFFIMCEGGEIDWKAHDNKTMPMIQDVLEFDDAVRTAYEFYLEHPEETVIVVTADHETGGISLGVRGGSRSMNWEKLEQQWIENGKKNTLDKEANQALNTSCSIGWTSYGHTGAPVPVYAIGKGAERFNGRLDNTEIKGKLLGKE